MNYALWEVIDNGATLSKTQVVDGVIAVMPITTVEEKVQRRLEVKARRTLMIAISNEHQLKFNSIKDAKQLLQKLVSHLELLGENLSQEDVNQKQLRSLSPKWNTHVVVWRNKVDLETMSMDDLYNNLKVYEPEVKGVNTANGVSSASTQVNITFSMNIDNLSDAIICAFLASQPNSSQLAHEDLEQIHLDDIEEGKKRIVLVETPAPTALVSCDGLGGYDWSDHEEVEPNYALMAYTSLTSDSKPVDENVKTKSSNEETKLVRKDDNKENNVTQPKIVKKTVRPNNVKKEFAKPRQQEKPTWKTVKKVKHNRQNTHRPRGNQRNWNNMMSQKLGSNFEMFNKACYGNQQIDLQGKGVIDIGLQSMKKLIEDMLLLEETPKERKSQEKVPLKLEEVVNTACYVQNRVLVVKPHNKTPYELFKADEGSKPDLLFDIDALTRTMSYELIVLDPKSSFDDGFKPSRDDEKKVDADLSKGSECNDQEKEKKVNSTNNVNTVSSTVNATGTNRVNVVGELLFDPDMPALLFLVYASFKDFMVYQMDVKSVFLYGKIKEKVYVYQPTRFVDPDFPDRVYKVEKALYRLHQAPGAWYETLSTYLLDNGFQRGKIEKKLFIKRYKGDILLFQVYVDDIIFGLTRKELCNAFERLMHEKFLMSSIGELTFFLGLQVKQKNDGIFISQDKYVAKILKKFGFIEVKNASTPMETQKPLLKDEDGEEVDVHMYRSMNGSLMYLTSSRSDIMFAVFACARYQVKPKVSHLYAVKRIFRYLEGHPKLGIWYPKDSPFDLVAYTDSDYARASLDRKSTTRGFQYHESRLISWPCKKQTVVSNSTTEAEYVAASS
nr:putative ribonuclease H-like domain-containing protein [Tanacetum cinerariifolium]